MINYLCDICGKEKYKKPGEWYHVPKMVKVKHFWSYWNVSGGNTDSYSNNNEILLCEDCLTAIAKSIRGKNEHNR